MYQAIGGLIIALCCVAVGCGSDEERFDANSSLPGSVTVESNDTTDADAPNDSNAASGDTTDVPDEGTTGVNPNAVNPDMDTTQDSESSFQPDTTSGEAVGIDPENTDSGETPEPEVDEPGPEGNLTGCQNRPGALRGTSQQTITAGGLTRTFIYHAPENLDPNQPAPLMIVPHGFTMSGQIMYDITGYHEIANREGFVVAYPDGALGLGPWNVGGGVCGNGALVGGLNDDQAFLDALLEFVDDDRCLDREHVFVSGFSMGGYFSNEVGCLRSDIAGIGPHSGGSHDLSSCNGSRKPAIVMHFRTDSLIEYACGVESAERWAEHNGCELASPDVRTLVGGECEYYKGCDEGGQVALCSFDVPADGGGTLLAGHGWAGGEPNAFSVVGTDSASEVGWQFFKEFAW